MVDTVTYSKEHPEVHTEFLVKVLLDQSVVETKLQSPNVLY